MKNDAFFHIHSYMVFKYEMKHDWSTDGCDYTSRICCILIFEREFYTWWTLLLRNLPVIHYAMSAIPKMMTYYDYQYTETDFWKYTYAKFLSI